MPNMATSISELLLESVRGSRTPVAARYDELFEWSLSRFLRHHEESAFVIMSAWRQERSLIENKRAMRQLMAMARSAGYGYVRVRGVGLEDGKEVAESSLIIISPFDPADSNGELRTRALRWARLFDQSTILYHTVQNGRPKTVLLDVKDRTVLDRFHKLNINTLAQFFTALKGGRSFAYEPGEPPPEEMP